MARINYVDQIENFWEIAAYNYELKPAFIAVYSTLLHINSKCNWTKEFEVSYHLISGFASVNKKVLFSALHYLKEIGLIESLIFSKSDYLPIKIILKVLV